MANVNKITAVKIKQQDNSYSEAIPIGVQAQNVTWDSDRNIKNVLGQVSATKGDVQTQIDNLKIDITNYGSSIVTQVDNWLDENITIVPEEGFTLDASLSSVDSAAQAKATGDAIRNAINSTIPAFTDLVAPVESGQLCYYNKEIYRRIDKSSTVPLTFEAVNWKKTTLADEQIANERMKRNIWYALNGGTTRIIFEQGAYTTTNGMEVPTLNNNSVKYCRTRYDMSPYMFEGDTISITTGYQFLIIAVEYTDAGLAKVSDVDLGGYKSGNFIIPFSGFFVIIVKNDSSTAVTPIEAQQSISIIYKGACKNLESAISDISSDVSDVDTTITGIQLDITGISSDIAETFPNIASTGKAGKLIWNNKNLIRSVNGYSSVPNSINAVTWKDTTLADEIEAKTLWMQNFYNAINGGKNTIVFEQGSASNTDGYLIPSDRTNFIRTRFDCIPFFVKNTMVKVQSGYEILITKVHIDKNGVVPEYNIGGWSSTPIITIEEDGLYFIYFRKVQPSGQTRPDITPAEGKANLTIEHPGLQISNNNSNNKSDLKRNPYHHLQWKPYSDDPTSLKPYLKEVISASHVHCETQSQFEALQAKYEHVALSNYYPSAPYYPLDKYFTGVGNTLSSPNSEHAYFSNVPTACHLNALGSYISRATIKPATNNPPGDYGWDGTTTEFITEAIECMKMPTGGGITINHPVWSGLTSSQIIDMLDSCKGIIAMEVWNSSCEGESTPTGDSSELWDEVLSTGRQIFGVAVPDHRVQYYNENIGYGYNHILVMNKTEDEILNAYKTGRFYCSKFNDGLTITYLDVDHSGLLSIEVSESSTIKFITATRNSSISSVTSGTFQTQADDIYVRVEVTRNDNKLWTNAVML